MKHVEETEVRYDAKWVGIDPEVAAALSGMERAAYTAIRNEIADLKRRTWRLAEQEMLGDHHREGER